MKKIIAQFLKALIWCFLFAILVHFICILIDEITMIRSNCEVRSIDCVNNYFQQ